MMDRRGQLVAIIPLSIALGIGGLLMWGYNSISRQSASAARYRLESDRFASVAIQRLKILAGRPIPTTGPCVALGASFQAIRNLGTEDAAPFELDYNFGGTPSPWLDCLYTTSEKTNLNHSSFGPIQSMKIKVSRQGKPDLETYSVFLTITAQAITRQVDEAQARSLSLREDIRLKASSLFRYPVVLRHPTEDAGTAGAGSAVSGTQLSHTSLARIEILGDVFRAGDRGAATPLNRIMSIASAASITIHGRLDIQAANLTIDSGTALDLSAANASLRKGVREKVFAGVPSLPIQDGLPAPFTPNANGAWNHYIQYPAAPAYRSQAIGYVNHYASDATGVAAFDTTETFTTPTPGLPPNDTCDTSPGVRNTYVRINFDQDLALTEANFGINNSFCGIIAANTVTIDVGASSNKLFLGHIIARKIHVTGSRTLYFAHPADNIALTSPSPAPDPAEVLRQMKETALLQGHNFNVPVLGDLSVLAAPQFQAHRPHGALADASAWKSGTFGVGSTVATFPPAGYMVRCEDDGTPPMYFCPRINLPLTPLNQAARAADLAAGLADQLVFE